MELEHDWGPNHTSHLYAQFIREVRKEDFRPDDLRVYEIAQKEYGNVDHFNEKLLAYLIACSTSCTECDIEPEYQQGNLPLLGRLIFEHCGDVETPFDYNRFGVHTKVNIQVGSLLQREDIYYIEKDPRYASKLPYGFLVEIWNNHQASMNKEKCDAMRGLYLDAIGKYPTLLEVVKLGGH